MSIPTNRKRGMATWVICTSLFLAAEQIAAEVPSGQAPFQHSGAIAAVSSDAYAGLDVINLDEMTEMRGGFSFGGLDMKFGATLVSLIDTIKYETVYNITSHGAEIVSQVLSNLGSMKESVAASSNVTDAPARVTTAPADATADPATTAVLVSPDTKATIADLSPARIDLTGVGGSNGFSGVVVRNNKGFTAAVHKLTRNQAISALISNASGLKASHKLDFKIEIQNAKSIRRASMRAALSKIARGRFGGK